MSDVTRDERQERGHQVAVLYGEGCSLADIAAALGTSARTAGRDLRPYQAEIDAVRAEVGARPRRDPLGPDAYRWSPGAGNEDLL